MGQIVKVILEILPEVLLDVLKVVLKLFLKPWDVLVENAGYFIMIVGVVVAVFGFLHLIRRLLNSN